MAINSPSWTNGEKVTSVKLNQMCRDADNSIDDIHPQYTNALYDYANTGVLIQTTSSDYSFEKHLNFVWAASPSSSGLERTLNASSNLIPWDPPSSPGRFKAFGLRLKIASQRSKAIIKFSWAAGKNVESVGTGFRIAAATIVNVNGTVLSSVETNLASFGTGAVAITGVLSPFTALTYVDAVQEVNLSSVSVGAIVDIDITLNCNGNPTTGTKVYGFLKNIEIYTE